MRRRQMASEQREGARGTNKHRPEASPDFAVYMIRVLQQFRAERLSISDSSSEQKDYQYQRILTTFDTAAVYVQTHKKKQKKTREAHFWGDAKC